MLYADMLRYCAQRGITKPASTTPQEFLHKIREGWSEAWPIVHSVTQLYARVRFGKAPLTTEEISTAENNVRQLRALRQSVRPAPRPSR
ncbi:MAG: DUF4129 domain-containing protein [Nitrospira sp.]|nr:DUF4129 domain-containing protein [Nitrospira sp.]